ncbi:uncharacterized protein B0H18DRAFT_1117695 [Fomitopsis serialis]|uniref:uncharacterized protein n=1 Tax=Fomitopsis serialis TaxID=139415 RepID=UPI002007C539|nr:uncharacterized protein B0H18DRAFT_1117695 [Neoantrodia serialis]KAH9928873.1 hypothetical protein B0H18DRAFT_1117695 [Neoantrodia serialis]
MMATVYDKDDPERRRQFRRILDTVGEDAILAYRDSTLGAIEDVLPVPLEMFNARNALEWLDIDNFKIWVVGYLQRTQSHAPSQLRTPQRRTPAPRLVDDSETVQRPRLRPLQLGSPVKSPAKHVSRFELDPELELWPPDDLAVDAAWSAPMIPTWGDAVLDSEPDGHASLPPSSPSPSMSSEPELHPLEVRRDDLDSDASHQLPNRHATPRKAHVIAKGKRKLKEVIEIEDSDLDDDVDKPKPSLPRPRGKKKPKRGDRKLENEESDEPEIVITRERSVRELKILTDVPRCWEVPEPGESFAFLLDLRAEHLRNRWKDTDGELMSMAAVIKAEDQDAWGKGTAGYVNRPVMVSAFGDKEAVPCRYAQHECQGVFHCEFIDSALFEGIQRYQPNDEDRRAFWEAIRAISEEDGTSKLRQAASFYTEVHRDFKCQCATDSSVKPTPILRHFKEMSNTGKEMFFGCSGYRTGDKPRSHTFIPIPSYIDEQLLLDMCKTNASTKHNAEDSAVVGGECAYVVPCRSGGKGRKQCPYTHLEYNDDSAVPTPKLGNLKRRQCTSRIRIWTPIDNDDRRAIVMLEGAHNHPTPALTKPSREAKEKYSDAVKAIGLHGLTVGKVDRAKSTQGLMGGLTPSEFDPALSNRRHRAKIIQNIRHDAFPHGLGLEGVMALYEKEFNSLPLIDRYIHRIFADGSTRVVVTMYGGLAALLHSAKATLHDNTYKRVHGKWKEWEATLWYDRLQMRVTYARIYCTEETREAFDLMWTALWKTVKDVTGKAVKFKFMHGCGLLGIVVDGCKPQAEACGDVLLRLNNPAETNINDSDPQVIIQRILKTCMVHLDRKFTDLSNSCPDDVMKRIRQFPYLKTEEELSEFQHWCATSSHKAIRDWYADKKPHPWFWASVNKHLSKIPADDWDLIPANTNLNESAHPFTNQHTGTNLPLLDSIQLARELDATILTKIRKAEEDCILPNHRNEFSQRLRENMRRATSRHKQASARTAASEQLTELEVELAEAQAQQREAQAKIKTLKDQTKSLRATGARKKTRPTKYQDGDVADDPAGSSTVIDEGAASVLNSDNGSSVPPSFTPADGQPSHALPESSTSESSAVASSPQILYLDDNQLQVEASDFDGVLENPRHGQLEEAISTPPEDEVTKDEPRAYRGFNSPLKICYIPALVGRTGSASG